MKKEAVYIDLKNRISCEEVLPDQWLVERDLCQSYGISRTPIREILQKLVNEGLVVFVSGKGYQIKRLSAEEIVAVFKFRAALEGYAVRMACQNPSPLFLKRIEEIKGKLTSLSAVDHPEETQELGRKLHDTIIDNTDNFLFKESNDKIRNYNLMITNITKKRASIEEHSRESHLKILNAIQSCDAEAAERFMKEHLQDTLELIYKNYLKISTELV